MCACFRTVYFLITERYLIIKSNFFFLNNDQHKTGWKINIEQKSVESVRKKTDE